MKFLKSTRQGFSLLFLAILGLAILQPTALAGCWKNVVRYCENYNTTAGMCEGEPLPQYCVTTDSYVHAITSNFPSGTTLINYYEAQCTYTCSWQDCHGQWQSVNPTPTKFQETSTFGPACNPPNGG